MNDIPSRPGDSGRYGVDKRTAALLGMTVRRADAAESRIAAALACHTQEGKHYACYCGYQWDLVKDRCTSPTVAALLGDA